MKDPHDLRHQAGQWRRQASFQAPRIAAALTLAARELEAQADRIEEADRTAQAGRTAETGPTGPGDPLLHSA